jgi:hypothetical protein
MKPNADRRGPTRFLPIVRGVMLIATCGLACDSSRPLDSADGSSPLASQAPDAGCPAPGFLSPCRVNSDCRNPYLVCEHPSAGVFVCRDPKAVDSTCPSPVAVDPATVPLCPATVPTPYAVCMVSYQSPCSADKDCGPAGFVCQSGRCQGSQASTSCTSASECPTGWDCYTPCPCSTRDAGTVTKVCEPPFATFNCPECPA